jgi:hypothetical protein
MIETENDKKDRITLILNKLLDSVFRAAALAKEKQTNIEAIVYVDKEGNDAVALVYDYKIVQMRSTTTFDNLAREHLGDPSQGPLIAYYNKIQNEHEAEAGSDIRIPILTRTQSNQGNKIYASPEMQDNYGRDIALNDNGGFAVAGGDFAVVKGQKNLAQAIGNRLTTSSKKRIRLGAYGIRATIGDTLALDSFLMGSIEQTVYEDPRIDRVDEIHFESTVKGDALYITVTYTDINGNQNTYKGEI